jgi:IclR family pca regulon transcriptional regulator
MVAMSHRKSEKPAADKSLVCSLEKGFRVLQAFDGQEPDMNLTQISRRTGLDAGTTFRLVKTLVKLGYLTQIENSKRYSLGLKVLDLGFSAIGRVDFRTRARPILRSLVSEVDEAASLGVLAGIDIVYIERIHAGLARMGVDIRIGSRVPAHRTTIGHSILAFLNAEQRERIIMLSEQRDPLPRATVPMAALEERFAEIRKQGYAVSDERFILFPGLRVVAAPILDDDGQPQGAMSIAAPTGRAPLESFLKETRKPLLDAAHNLGRAMNLSGGSALAIPA